MHDPEAEHRQLALDLLRRHDGLERVGQLPHARFVAVAPAAGADQPVHVEISWTPDTLEHPFPGSALWRAALTRRLAEPQRDDPADRVLREQIIRSLERFPDLDSWWHWLRTGWTAPPDPDADRTRRDRRRSRSGRRW